MNRERKELLEAVARARKCDSIPEFVPTRVQRTRTPVPHVLEIKRTDATQRVITPRSNTGRNIRPAFSHKYVAGGDTPFMKRTASDGTVHLHNRGLMHPASAYNK